MNKIVAVMTLVLMAAMPVWTGCTRGGECIVRAATTDVTSAASDTNGILEASTQTVVGSRSVQPTTTVVHQDSSMMPWFLLWMVSRPSPTVVHVTQPAHVSDPVVTPKVTSPSHVYTPKVAPSVTKTVTPKTVTPKTVTPKTVTPKTTTVAPKAAVRSSPTIRKSPTVRSSARVRGR